MYADISRHADFSAVFHSSRQKSYTVRVKIIDLSALRGESADIPRLVRMPTRVREHYI